MKFWRWRKSSASPRQDKIIASQREKLQEETEVVQQKLFTADQDQQVANAKLQEAKEMRYEAGKVGAALQREEELNGLAVIFHKGLAGGTR